MAGHMAIDFTSLKSVAFESDWVLNIRVPTAPMHPNILDFIDGLELPMHVFVPEIPGMTEISVPTSRKWVNLLYEHPS